MFLFKLKLKFWMLIFPWIFFRLLNVYNQYHWAIVDPRKKNCRNACSWFHDGPYIYILYHQKNMIFRLLTYWQIILTERHYQKLLVYRDLNRSISALIFFLYDRGEKNIEIGYCRLKPENRIWSGLSGVTAKPTI